MTTRTNDRIVSFAHPFLLKGVDRELPAGDYRVVTDEELIEGLSFPVYRRVSTMIFVPGPNASSFEMVTIDPQELKVAHARDQDRGV
jgi:hypothetical protein